MGGLGGVGLISGGTFGWFTVEPWTDLVESKELGWCLDCLGNKLVVWMVRVWFGGSIRLAWMVFGWFVIVSGLGRYWAHLGGKWVF